MAISPFGESLGLGAGHLRERPLLDHKAMKTMRRKANIKLLLIQ
jgi:hypothetical protein